MTKLHDRITGVPTLHFNSKSFFSILILFVEFCELVHFNQSRNQN